MSAFRLIVPLRGSIDWRLPIFLFVSGPRGLEILKECLFGILSNFVRVVAVFTDNPQCPPNAKVRSWQYRCFDKYRRAVVDYMHQAGYLVVEEFHVEAVTFDLACSIVEQLPAVDRRRLTGFMCGYGRLINPAVIGLFPGGFKNVHPSAIARVMVDDSGPLPRMVEEHGLAWPRPELQPIATDQDEDGPVYTVAGETVELFGVHEHQMVQPCWPSAFRGPQPWERMMLYFREQANSEQLPSLLATVVIHEIDPTWDGGELLAWSSWFPVVKAPQSLPLYRRGRHVVTDEAHHDQLGELVLKMHHRALEPTIDVCQTLLSFLQKRSLRALL